MRNEIKKEKQRNDYDTYHILFILTDGVVHDMKETLDSIIDLSILPISIIIIGIGDSDFDNMEILDGDEMPIINPNGNQEIPDIIQFVKYNDFKHDAGLLAEQVLYEVPDQFVAYMSANDKMPKKKHQHKP